MAIRGCGLPAHCCQPAVAGGFFSSFNFRVLMKAVVSKEIYS
jgi:hypothetical protein